MALRKALGPAHSLPLGSDSTFSRDSATSSEISRECRTQASSRLGPSLADFSVSRSQRSGGLVLMTVLYCHSVLAGSQRNATVRNHRMVLDSTSTSLVGRKDDVGRQEGEGVTGGSRLATGVPLDRLDFLPAVPDLEPELLPRLALRHGEKAVGRLGEFLQKGDLELSQKEVYASVLA